jgi:glycosyltransferase involved in cell wall biosynthesis
MQVYGRELAASLASLPDSHDVRLIYVDGELRRALGRVGGYLDRYLAYQLRACSRADVSHVLDHGYGHLAFRLDPGHTVVTVHDTMLLKIAAGEVPGSSGRRLTTLAHRISLSAIRRVARVITDSESGRQDFLRFVDYDPARVIVVPLGVAQLFNGPARQTSDLNTILHVGHCDSYKNIETMIETLPLVSNRLGRPVVLLKAGGAFTSGQRQLIARLGLEAQIHHLGQVDDPALAALYRRAGCLMMPSLDEGFGLPALESMASGTPVVASNRGSLPEVVGDAGLLVDPEDREAIAEAVCRVLSDLSLRRTLKRKGRERAACFTWEATARRTLAVYEQIAA